MIIGYRDDLIHMHGMGLVQEKSHCNLLIQGSTRQHKISSSRARHSEEGKQ